MLLSTQEKEKKHELLKVNYFATTSPIFIYLPYTYIYLPIFCVFHILRMSDFNAEQNGNHTDLLEDVNMTGTAVPQRWDPPPFGV